MKIPLDARVSQSAQIVDYFLDKQLKTKTLSLKLTITSIIKGLPFLTGKQGLSEA